MQIEFNCEIKFGLLFALSLEKSFDMKKKSLQFVFLTLVLLLLSNISFSQKVYSVRYKSDAKVKVYVSKYKSDADLVVYKCKYKSDAIGNSGLWYFCEYKSDADKTIYFCDYKSDANLIIYFADYKSDAGWRNNSKKHIMY